jgi:hypothetical protein
VTRVADRIDIVIKDFIVSFHLRTDENGTDVIGAPYIPLRIQAECAASALQVFAHRSEGRIIDALRQIDEQMLEAAVNVDHKIYRVFISNGS